MNGGREMLSRIFAHRKVSIDTTKEKGKWIPCMNTTALDIEVELMGGNNVKTTWTFKPSTQLLFSLLWFLCMVVFISAFGTLMNAYIFTFEQILKILLCTYMIVGLGRLFRESTWWTIKLYQGEVVE